MSKLWVDDIVPPVTEAKDWRWARNYAEAISALRESAVAVLSLDYDLSDFDGSLGKEWRGEDVLEWLARNPARWPREIRLHTGNPVGRRRMRSMIAATGLYAGPHFAIYDNFRAYPDARPEKRQVDVFARR